MARPQRRARRFDSRRRRKVSILTKEKIDYVDYKDVTLLRRFISDRAKIRPRRVTGNNEQQQRAVALAIKNAREMALLPYENRITTQRRSSDRRSYEPEDAPDGNEPESNAPVRAEETRPGAATGIPAPPRRQAAEPSAEGRETETAPPTEEAAEESTEEPPEEAEGSSTDQAGEELAADEDSAEEGLSAEGSESPSEESSSEESSAEEEQQ